MAENNTAAAEQNNTAAEDVKGGELLFCGATCWDAIGRRKNLSDSNLCSPTRLRPLVGIDIRLVVSGGASCHCVALDVEGRCYTWGRNEKGQLGHGDTIQRDRPTIVSGLSKHKIVGAASGRSHTVVVTKDGSSFSFGWNKHGQLGSGSARNEYFGNREVRDREIFMPKVLKDIRENEIEPSPVRCVATDVKTVACGAEFTVWLSSLEGASILTAGLPQYGQLGHGTDNEYNSKEGSVKLVYEAQPRPKAIALFADQTIVKVACGTNHTVAVDSNGYVYTWGFGGYGRLGHREQKDEWAPRRVDVFTRHNVLPPNAVISAGSVNSSCTAAGGQLYMWGKIKNNGDDWMYPKPVMDLSGWNIHCMHSGSMHHFVGADNSCISWGHAQSGELGYGPNAQKSSAIPKKVDILDGMHVISVACGFAHSMVVVDRTNVADRLDQLEIYDGKPAGEASEETVSESPAVKKPAKKAAGRTPDQKTKKRKSEDSSEESDEEERESDYENDDSEDDHVNGKTESKPKRGGKTGRGRGKAASKSTEKGSSGRGRGRPKKTTTESDEKPPSSGKRGRPRKVK